MDVGARIREAREAAGLSRARLGAMTGIAESTIEAWELRGVDPGTMKTARIAAALGVSIVVLVPDLSEVRS